MRLRIEGRGTQGIQLQHRHGQLPAGWRWLQLAELQAIDICLDNIILGGGDYFAVFNWTGLGIIRNKERYLVKIKQDALDDSNTILRILKIPRNINPNCPPCTRKSQIINKAEMPRAPDPLYISRVSCWCISNNKRNMFEPTFQASQLCSQCRQGILLLSEKGTFCSICHRYTSTLQFQHDTLKVPDNYKTNTKTNTPSSRQRNSKLYMNEFAQKYGVRAESDIDILVGEINRYLEDATRCKSYREVCAAIFYYNYRREFRLTVKGFCVDNQVCLKRFAKALMRYVAVKNRQEGEMKVEEVVGEEEGNQGRVEERCEGFLRSVSKELFDFQYCNEDRKEQYVKAVMKTIKKTGSREAFDSSGQQIALIVFTALKRLNHPVSLVKFELICKSQGIAITRRTLREALKEKKTKKEEPVKKAEMSELSLQESTSNLY